MASKQTLIFVLVLVCVMAATEAQLGLIGGLLGLIRIQGTLFCTLNGNIGNGTATPAFPNANVQLLCGQNNRMIASATTNAFGIFSIVLDPLQFLVSSVLNGCNLKVDTPLSTCNPNLPSLGVLQSPLQLVGNTVAGALSVTNIIPRGFNFLGI
ncbi:phylloplanin-like [Mercurialis annua]|uniref:phylloplanin-like n=1 Tax=Mercurialis annua TaxID=3986 RepID=UPI00215EE06F|nr:phylloplanin-like [Mercurialis annua]